MLPEMTSATPAQLRLRRTGLLFLLALPGQVTIDVQAECELQRDHTDEATNPEAIIRSASGEREFFRGAGSAITVLSDGNDRGGWWQPGLVVTYPRKYLGILNIANFTDRPCPLPDGAVVLASDNPKGPVDHTSDNDMLPARTTVWLAGK